MALKHSVYDTDAHFKIDAVTRQIRNDSSGKTVLIQGDHNSERFTFEVPRLVDGHDLSLCDVVQVHYINIDSTDKTKVSKDLHEVDDLQISPDDDSIVILSWLIDCKATRYAGTLHFAIKFKCTDGGVKVYEWNTMTHTGISVSSGIDNGETIVDDYSDILEQWRQALFDEGAEAVVNITAARNQAMSDITTNGAQTLAEVDAARSEALQRIAENGGVTDEEIQAAVGHYLESHPASGLNTNTKNILMYLFRSAVYTADVSQVIQMLDEMWYEDVTEVYSITNNLTDVVNSNAEISIAAGKTYTATLTPAVGNYVLDSVTVTMGGEDVTASVYADGEINIPIVTGAIVITAVAVEYTTPVIGWQIGSLSADDGSPNTKETRAHTDYIPCDSGNNTVYVNLLVNGADDVKFGLRVYDRNHNNIATHNNLNNFVTSHNIVGSGTDAKGRTVPAGWCWNATEFKFVANSNIAYARVYMGRYEDVNVASVSGTITVSGVEYELVEV